ncbi:alpha/beta hydrolase [Adonisia turfae]|uniref:Alpha/beta hydrolase n=1 Tax=Adonisia turfae CCMR0081 TaxID=2292702 RepID=A0A6M0RTG0_9CYAN|nr:alpha/beta hydrolase [Adonisia turfae]NEZ59554.1 alpha/beta hydrolase [Adonisia turfae CCMR0081]
MVTYFITLISQLLSLINSTNHIWLPPIVTFIVIKLICHRHFRRRWGALCKRGALLGVMGYITVFILLWTQQPRLLYRPTHALQTTPESHNLHYEDVWIPVAQDKQSSPEHLHSWWLPKTKQRMGTLLYLHGAGLNIGFHVTQVHWLRKLGFDVLLAEYRGYGLSEGGFPTERSFYEDAEAALGYLTDGLGIAANEIVVYGHSLGGAIAIDLASKHPNLAGVIVQNTFTSMSAMVARSVYARWFPVQAILHQRFESIQKVRQLQIPILFIHSTGDPLIPLYMGKKLYKAARGPKDFIVYKANVHHNAVGVFKESASVARLKQFARKVLSVS